jgi:hypothetical protein
MTPARLIVNAKSKKTQCPMLQKEEQYKDDKTSIDSAC